MHHNGLAQMLKEHRKKKGLTQIQLAKRAKITQPYIVGLERGDKLNPSLAVLQRLAKALKITVAELVE